MGATLGERSKVLVTLVRTVCLFRGSDTVS